MTIFASGTILGISYDISKWEWKLCKSKADRLTELLFDLVQLDQIQNKVLKRILGNILLVTHVINNLSYQGK